MARQLLLRGMLAGVLAGMVAFAIARLLGEPQLAAALSFENGHHAADHAIEPELVSRFVQGGIGLLTACVTVGVALGGILAIVFACARGRFGPSNATTLSLLLAGAGFVALVLVPQLKYPANPPAFGSHDTIGMRTVLYFEMMSIALGALVLSIVLVQLLSARISRVLALSIGVLAFACLVGAMQLALPSIHEVPADFPQDVLWRFRAGSLATQLALWLGLGAIFGVLARRTLHD